MTEKFAYRCISCDAVYPGEGVRYRCPVCSEQDIPGQPQAGMLKLEYGSIDRLKGSPAERLRSLQEEKFVSLLPVLTMESLGNLRVGHTPFISLEKMGNEKLPFRLILKDDSQNPTFSFKDRASVLVSAFAKEQGIQTLIAASTGNAGSSLAGICASQGQRAIILAPAAAPLAKLTQICMYGATLVPVDGNYDTAFDLSVALTGKYGWYNRNTAFNPITVEGKKTVAFEIVTRFFPDLPQRIFVPCGDGVILSGLYKGFEDLMKAGVIRQIPVVVAVQAEGSDNLVRNLHKATFTSVPSTTLADSISVDIPRNFYMARDFLLKYGGETVTVSDEQILEASGLLAANSGIFAEPAAAAAFAGMLRYKQEGRLGNNSTHLVLLTGSGLKDLGFVKPLITMQKPVGADLDSISGFLEKQDVF